MIEELIKNIPVSVTGKDKSNGNDIYQGLTFHWSTTNECWVVCYGNKPSINKKGAGNGATLSYAIKDFIEKQKQFGK